jgi:hypothetical protein
VRVSFTNEKVGKESAANAALVPGILAVSVPVKERGSPGSAIIRAPLAKQTTAPATSYI